MPVILIEIITVTMCPASAGSGWGQVDDGDGFMTIDDDNDDGWMHECLHAWCGGTT